MTSSKDINIRVMQRKQRIVGHDNHRFAMKLLVMPDRCVAYGCNKADPENEIGLHKIPFFLETIVRNAAEDEEDGSTLYFAD